MNAWMEGPEPFVFRLVVGPSFDAYVREISSQHLFQQTSQAYECYVPASGGIPVGGGKMIDLTQSSLA